MCSGPLPATVAHCPRCGFPTALYAGLAGPLPEVAAEPDGGEAAPVLPELPTRRRAPNPGAEVSASLARALEERTELLRTIDRDAPEVTSELCEAALNEAAGRLADAQQILRSAHGRLERETEELLTRHLTDLQRRGRELEASGLRLAQEEELATLAERLVASQPASSVADLLDAERRLDRVEAHWRGLQALLGQVASLREEAADLGLPPDPRAERLTALRDTLASRPAGERELDTVAQAAAEALMVLHEAIPPALEQELARHGATLEAAPAHPVRARAARRLHGEARRHLAEGHLDSALVSMRELRAELATLAREAREAEEVRALPEPTAPAPPPPREEAAPTPRPAEPARPPSAVPTPAATPTPAPPPRFYPPPPTAVPRGPEPGAPPEAAPMPPSLFPADGPPSAEAIGLLLQKARGLAARVRALPPDSEEAVRAAREIHEATELLRARHFREADAALTRLMRTLALPPSRS